MRTLLLLCIALSVNGLFAQHTVTGTVTADGLPAIGVTVQVKGTTVGTVTGFEGEYQIDAPDGEAVLVFHYLGYISQEHALNGRTVLNVTLEESLSQLQEIVVTGYGVQKRSNISGAVSTVLAEEIAERPILRLEQALQGTTPGVLVAHNSGSPGSALTVRIRGNGTINDSDPLYIVDGIPVSGLDFLNPNDIETINILKDAAAAAIYGARGANGVVLVTTKSGKRNTQGRITYDAYYGIQRASRLVELLNAEEYATLMNEAYIAAGKVPLPEFAQPDVLGRGTDWQEAVFGHAPISSHQLTIRGGAEKSDYSLSGSYFNQDGIIGGDKSNFKRATVRLNGNHDLKNWLTLGNAIGFTWLQRNALIENTQYDSPLIRALNIDPVTPVRKANGTYAYSNYTDTDIANPVNGIEQTHNNWTTYRLVGGVHGDIRLARGLTFRSAFSTDITFAQQRNFYPKFDLSNLPHISEAPPAEKRLVNSVGIANHNWRNIQWENYVTWNTVFGQKHNLTLIAGTTALTNRYDGSGGGNTNLPSNDPKDAFIGNTIDPIESQTAWQTAYESALLSWFGKANYEWNNRYLLSATLRVDGSSRFGRNNRYGWFPSFSAGWVISEESFWNISAIDFLKLRASWGQNGNDRIGDYSFTTVVSTGQNYTFGPDETITNGSVPLRAANPDLKWETITQSNIGVDVSMLDGRLSFTGDYFIKKTSDMLYASPIPLVAGTEPPVRNVATAENKGLELGLNIRNKIKSFDYNIGGNITFINSVVTGLGEGGEPVLSGHIQFANASAARTDIGHPLASFYGYVTDGIFQSYEEVEAHAFQSAGTSPGDIRFKDLNGDGIINIDDQTWIGNPIPRFTYGFNAGMGWKGFEVSLFFQGTEGNDIFNNTTRYDFIHANRRASALERWTGPGTSNFEPRVNLEDPNQNARISDRFIEDGSYMRLKMLQIGYNLPESVLRRVGVENLKVYMTAHNLLTFTKYSGLDPEIGSVGGSLELGIDHGYYPQPRSIIGGISLTF